MVVELDDFPLHRDPQISAMLLDNHVGYLSSLMANDHYRRWANLQPLKTIRSIKARVEKTDLSP
jgi:hypothetical protein